jgi:hypothetical protein
MLTIRVAGVGQNLQPLDAQRGLSLSSLLPSIATRSTTNSFV